MEKGLSLEGFDGLMLSTIPNLCTAYCLARFPLHRNQPRKISVRNISPSNTLLRIT